jgi:hypothetical protein
MGAYLPEYARPQLGGLEKSAILVALLGRATTPRLGVPANLNPCHRQEERFLTSGCAEALQVRRPRCQDVAEGQGLGHYPSPLNRSPTAS